MNIILETKRLFLRQFLETDADHLFWLNSHPEVIRWGNGGNPTSYETIQSIALPKANEYYQKYDSFGIWAAIEKSSQSFIGWFHFFPAIENKFGRELKIVAADEIALGYRLHPDFWGQGYATEMSRGLVVQGFRGWNVERVVAWTLCDNYRSIRVMEKVGLLFECDFEFTETQLPNLNQPERKGVKYSISRPSQV